MCASHQMGTVPVVIIAELPKRINSPSCSLSSEISPAYRGTKPLEPLSGKPGRPWHQPKHCHLMRQLFICTNPSTAKTSWQRSAFAVVHCWISATNLPQICLKSFMFKKFCLKYKHLKSLGSVFNYLFKKKQIIVFSKDALNRSRETFYLSKNPVFNIDNW